MSGAVTSPSPWYATYAGSSSFVREEVASPGTGLSVSVALNPFGPVSSSATLIGVGYNTLNVSIFASQPQLLNWASVHSALALSCADPTWLGSAAMVFIQPS